MLSVKCWVLSVALVLEGGSKTIDDAGCFHGKISGFLKLVFGEIANVQCNIELGTNFRARGLGNNQKMVKFSLAGSLKSLSYIGHHGNRCSLNLSTQSKVFAKRLKHGQCIDALREFSGPLPCNQVLELTDWR
nr:hypothetical protein [Desulfonatronum thioautotrophicum]